MIFNKTFSWLYEVAHKFLMFRAFQKLPLSSALVYSVQYTNQVKPFLAQWSAHWLDCLRIPGLLLQKPLVHFFKLVHWQQLYHSIVRNCFSKEQGWFSIANLMKSHLPVSCSAQRHKSKKLCYIAPTIALQSVNILLFGGTCVFDWRPNRYLLPVSAYVIAS